MLRMITHWTLPPSRSWGCSLTPSPSWTYPTPRFLWQGMRGTVVHPDKRGQREAYAEGVGNQYVGCNQEQSQPLIMFMLRWLFILFKCRVVIFLYSILQCGTLRLYVLWCRGQTWWPKETWNKCSRTFCCFVFVMFTCSTYALKRLCPQRWLLYLK